MVERQVHSIESEPAAQDELIRDVAASATFAKAPALRKLLLFLWEQRNTELSEYSIAVDALGKREDFDPKLDASVRVHVSRLRARLKEYFENEGEAHPFRVSIPSGGHQLHCVWERDDAVASPFWRAVGKWALPVALVGFVAISATLFIRNRQMNRELALARQNLVLPEIWQAMLKPGRVTRVIYPTPVFYAWGDLRIRDVKNSAADGWKTSPRLKTIVDLFGEPDTTSKSYTVSSDTAAAIELTRFLSSHGVPLEVTNTTEVLPHQYGSDNLIFLGIPPTNPSLHPYLNRTNFYLTDGQNAIGNRNPKPGEPAIYRVSQVREGSSLIARFGLLTVLPGHAPNTSLILLMGLQTSAIATFAGSPSHVENWTREWRKAGAPSHFEVVLLSRSDGVITKEVEIVAFRSIT
ncbi:MAG: hypothetical protein IT170_17065 [Bryobacterales bacterium]|nr:hypothetical protein [Bryobacterales bacterium]